MNTVARQRRLAVALSLRVQGTPGSCALCHDGIRPDVRSWMWTERGRVQRMHAGCFAEQTQTAVRS